MVNNLAAVGQVNVILRQPLYRPFTWPTAARLLTILQEKVAVPPP